MYCRLNQAIVNGFRNVCYQGITFTVSFCEHSHTFVKIDEFVMGHPCRNGITSCLHALLKILHVTAWAYTKSSLDHCLGRTFLELITNYHYSFSIAHAQTMQQKVFLTEELFSVNMLHYFIFIIFIFEIKQLN